jgi:uncharacterized membrane protein
LATQLRPAPRVEISGEIPPGANIKKLRAAGIVLGLGLGGFIDGILFHMLLQWHHVICVNCLSPTQTTDDLRLETFSDGVFHGVTLALVVAGLFMLWRAVRRVPAILAASFLVGAILLGWGSFNLAEGVLDHHILGIHHVKLGPNQLAWDLAFLASGVVLVIIGPLIMKSAQRSASPETRLGVFNRTGDDR